MDLLQIHSAEGLIYRDVFRDACQISYRINQPASLDISAAGKVTAIRGPGSDARGSRRPASQRQLDPVQALVSTQTLTVLAITYNQTSQLGCIP
jgi:hypothetical protein